MDCRFSYILTLVSFLFLATGYGQKTTLYFQNNTSFEYYVSGIQYGNTLDTNKWAIKVDTIKPWQENVAIFETSRNSGISNNKTYYFDVYLVHDNDTIILQIKVKGNFIASSLDFSLKGNSFDHPWYDNDVFYTEDFFYNSIPVTVKYKPLGNDISYSRDLLYAIQDNRPRYTINPNDLTNKYVLNVLSYNIKMIPPPLNNNNSERGKTIPKYINENQDVVVFQEAFEEGIINDHIEPRMVAKGFIYRTQFLNENNSITQQNGGVVMFSKWPILLTDEYEFRSCDNNKSDCMADKGILYAKINKLGKNYHIFGTHMDAGQTAGDIAVRKEQFGEMRDFIALQNIPAKEAVIMAGDMNTAPSDSMYWDLIDSLNPIIGKHIGLQSSHDYYEDTLDIVDHVWGDRTHLTPIDCHTNIWLLRAVDNDVWEIFNPSDHLPVNGRFEYLALEETNPDTTDFCPLTNSISLSVKYFTNATYQWFLNGTPIANATNFYYTKLNPSSSDTGMYSCQIAYQFIAEDTTALAHPNWPDTSYGSFLLFKNYLFSDTISTPTIKRNLDTIFSNMSPPIDWYDNNGLIMAINDSILVIDTTISNTYYASARKGNCISNYSNTIIMDKPSSIQKISTNEFLLYPNPVENTLTIENSSEFIELVEIIDQLGQLVYTKTEKSKIIPTALHFLSSGTYFVKIHTTSGSRIEKIYKL